jgi:hypothetical protein
VALGAATKIKLSCCFISLSMALSACGGGGGSPASTSPPPAPPPASPQPPTIAGTTFTGTEDSSLAGRIVFADPEGGVLQVSVTAQPTHGTLSGPDATGLFSYSPRANFFGADAFTVSVTDSQNLDATATVALTIASVNDVPTAASENALTAPGVAVTIPVLANDSDIEGQPLQPQVSTQSPNGTAQAQPDGTVVFTPAVGFAGTTQFQYRAVDAEGGASAPVTIDVNVRPLKSAVYYTAEGTDQRVVFDSPYSTRRLSPTLASGSSIQNLQVSRDGRTALWQVGRGGLSTDLWYHVDPTDANASARFFGGTSFNTRVELSPAGTHVLVPASVQVGYNMSTVVHLQSLATGYNPLIHSAPATDQIQYYWFSPGGEFVFYRTNEPTRFETNVNFYRVELDTPDSPTRLAHSFSTTEFAGTNAKVTPDGSRLVFDGSINDFASGVLRSTRTDGSTNAQVIGPVVTEPGFEILDFEIAPTNRHVAFTNRTGMTPPQYAVSSYVVDLETGGYARIGTGFTASHRVTQPAFNRDGTKVVLGISSGTEAAVYEASVQNPAVLTRVGASHAGAGMIGQVRYAAGDRVVYTADVRQSGVFEVFVAQEGQSQRLNADLGTGVSVIGGRLSFAVSSDGTTVAYTQPATAAAPHDLFLVDVTTPGLPLKIGENVSIDLFEDQAFSILD